MTERLRSPGRITATALRPLFEAVRAGGGDPAGVVRSCGADPRAFEGREGGWLSALLSDRIWVSAASMRADLPLRLAEGVGPATYGLLTYLLASCESVGDALGAITRYYPVLSESTTYRLEGGAGGVLVSVDLHGPRPAAVESFAAAVSLNFLRGQARAPLEVIEVRLAQARPEGAAAEAHARAFGAPLRYGCAGAGYVLAHAALGVPLRGADAGLRALLEENATRRLAAPAERSLAERVREQIAARGATCATRSAEVAADLAMSERTLRRSLRAEGTAFQAELDAVLARVASERLVGEGVEDVAAALGFADAATFRRAFRRWRGVAPRAYAARRPGPR